MPSPNHASYDDSYFQVFIRGLIDALSVSVFDPHEKRTEDESHATSIFYYIYTVFRKIEERCIERLFDVWV